MKYINSLIFVGLLTFAPTMYAATYQYVDTSGNLRTVIADNAQIALATAINKDRSSGVMLVSISTPAVTPTVQGIVLGASCSPNQYDYVTTFGSLATITASNPQIALTAAPNRASDSGVIQSCNL